MTFDDIPSGATVFLDANILVYAASQHPQHGPACERLPERMEQQTLQGCTSAEVLGDLAHRLMTIEAALSCNRPMTGIANWVKRHPAEIQRLARYRQAIDDLQAVPVTILPVTGGHVSRAVDFCRQFGLMVNDAVVVAVMRDHGLTHLASLDADFDRVPGLTRYAP